MKGKLISTGFVFEVQFEEDGVRKHLNILPDTDTSEFKLGQEVEFDKVVKLNEGVTYTSEDGWNRNPVEGEFAKIHDEWDEIQQEYLKDEYPVFGGPFTDALTPWEWLKKYYEPAKRK